MIKLKSNTIKRILNWFNPTILETHGYSAATPTTAHVIYPGQVIYVENPDKFIIPNVGDDTEEYW